MSARAPACVIGRECKTHTGSTHGQEAERLRSGVEAALNYPPERLESELRALAYLVAQANGAA